MGRKSLKEVRRAEIIEVFHKVANSQGLHNTSIAMIAEEMEVNPSLIMHYFKSKEDLLFSLIEYILNKYLIMYEVNKTLGLLDQLTELLDNLFSTKWDNLVSDHVYYSCYTMVFTDPLIRDKYKQLHDSLRLSLENHLIACKKANLLSIEDPRVTANLIYTILEGVYYYQCMVTGDNQKSEYMSHYKAHVYNLLGLEPKEARQSA